MALLCSDQASLAILCLVLGIGFKKDGNALDQSPTVSTKIVKDLETKLKNLGLFSLKEIQLRGDRSIQQKKKWIYLLLPQRAAQKPTGLEVSGKRFGLELARKLL